MKITIGIPAYNEEENIGEVITKLKKSKQNILFLVQKTTK